MRGVAAASSRMLEAAVRQYVCSGNAVITQEFVFKLE